MLTLVFVVFVAMFATAGTFLSIEAKRRGDSGGIERGTTDRDR
jgi:hypothetical protein